MRYRLLKELPLFPKGTICAIVREEFVEGDSEVEVVREVKDSKIGEIVMECGELKELREKGTFNRWFEKIEAFAPVPRTVYYYITSCGEIKSHTLGNELTDEDYQQIEIGNCFGDKIEAQKAVDQLKALRRLRMKGLYFERGVARFCREEKIATVDVRAKLSYEVSGGSAEFHKENASIIADTSLLFDE